ncbi:MAG: hypothetical protein LBB81_09505 [Treponema sp.]|jgi:hypothetical protein|nr:hypothetical protein [Treponema sp.]
MAAFISAKKSVLLLFITFVVSVSLMFLLNFLFKGPKLGSVYDFFLKQRRPLPVSREILVINTGEYVESAGVFSALMAMTETGASSLVLQARILGSSSPIAGNDEEIRYRIADEYKRIESNIRSLFEAIRTGSVTPAKAPDYVDSLVDLTRRGGDRLVSGLLDRDEDLLRAAAVFGNYYEANLKSPVDPDGVLRRVHPAAEEYSDEHVVFQILKKRFNSAEIEKREKKSFLVLKRTDGINFEIPLDRGDNILLAKNDSNFRKIDISLFRGYEDASRAMRQALNEADELGAFSLVQAEVSPLVLGDYAQYLLEELLKNPDEKKRDAWIAARGGYIKYLNEFLYGTPEKKLTEGFGNVLAEKEIDNMETAVKLEALRDEMVRSFSVMREKHREFEDVYNLLRRELNGSFCVMGPYYPDSAAEYSALFANTLMSGSHIKPAAGFYSLVFPAGAVLLLLLIVFSMPCFTLFFTGAGISIVVFFAFGLGFTFSGYWIDPLTAFIPCMTGTLILFYCKYKLNKAGVNRFRAAYGNAVHEEVLNNLLKKGKPKVNETITCHASVIAVKDPEILRKIENEKPEYSAQTEKKFYNEAKRLLFGKGAVIAGYEGNMVVACFGSPLNKSNKCEYRARSLVRELLADKDCRWYFGIDSGECSFYWSAEKGYSVNGKPAVRAKVLASKTNSHKVRAIISDSTREQLGMSANRIGALHENSDFYFEFPG